MANYVNEKQEKIAQIIKDNKFMIDKYTDSLRFYFVDSITEKGMAKIVKNFDSAMSTTSFIAYIDTTLTHCYKEGIVFMEDGLYFKDLFDRYYINYKDIIRYYEKKEELHIEYKLKDDTKEITYLAACLNGHVFLDILTKICDIDKDYESNTLKVSGDVKKLDIPPEMAKKCKNVIHSASIACGGIGAITAASVVADSVLITTVQVPMVLKLAQIFDLDITEAAAKSIVLNYAATFAGKRVSQFFWGKIPLLGNGINAVTAGGLTEAVGWATVANFYYRWVSDQSKGFASGVKQGYIVASDAYEKKYSSLLEEMKLTKEKYINTNKENQEIMDGYEKYIDYLEGIIGDNLSDIRLLYEKLEKDNEERVSS
ncbi:Uncharacterized conserved protein, DUF697 family [Pseudobutyrivibrio sp. YE44]|uniref:hypothetical protein n=1 Tax=Pseudobutyrivibrio sp. YE44 TaxID=1520802 RepID=UPI00088CB16D|nr:hypothetical protein [Pseudobutyrivibrio sp. YE44]SDB44809.1 Uncharacterized conserved protein, DUF697 family [Pseudobutyrivibrio sp. YE44]